MNNNQQLRADLEKLRAETLSISYACYISDVIKMLEHCRHNAVVSVETLEGSEYEEHHYYLDR